MIYSMKLETWLILGWDTPQKGLNAKQLWNNCGTSWTRDYVGHITSVTRWNNYLQNISPFLHKFKSWAIFGSFICYSRIFWTCFDKTSYAIGHILIVANDQKNHNWAIWSHGKVIDWRLLVWRYFALTTSGCALLNPF